MKKTILGYSILLLRDKLQYLNDYRHAFPWGTHPAAREKRHGNIRSLLLAIRILESVHNRGKEGF